MLQYVAKRIVAMIITLFIIISLSFFAIRLIPGDVAGENAAPEIKQAMEQGIIWTNRWENSTQSLSKTSSLLILASR